MRKRILQSEKGLTMVELMISLAIFSMISILIIGYLVSSMNNFQKVNEEIKLHDEANYVMSQFVNYIFVATDVEPFVPDPSLVPSGCYYLIKVKNYGQQETIIGFADGQAVIFKKNDATGILEKTSLSEYTFPCNDSDNSKITISEADELVKIKMVIRNNTDSKFSKELVLDSEVSYIHVQ